MTAFSMVLLEEGIEADLPISLSNMLGLLDQVVPGFHHNGHGYQLASVNRARLGSDWELSVKLVDNLTHQTHPEPVGCVVVEKTGSDSVNFRIPPRSEQDFPGDEQVRLGRGLFRLLHLPDAQCPAQPGADGTARPAAHFLGGSVAGDRGSSAGLVSDPPRCSPDNGIIATGFTYPGPDRRDARRIETPLSSHGPQLNKVLVIGSGPIVIGQAAEFDYAGTQACKALREEGVVTVLVNSNPATIMTDRDIADHVYIEPLTVEVIERIIQREQPQGILPTLGGQTGLNLAVALADAGILERYNVRLLGTPLETIRKSEDREYFRNFLHDIGEPEPPNVTVSTLEAARAVGREMGLPLVVRPAYTLGGTGGGIANTWSEFEDIVQSGLASSPISQVLLERSLVGWKEVEYEVIRDSADNCITVCNMENLDPMGSHTGDSIVVAPSQTLTDKEYQMLRTASLKIIRGLGIEGGCNIQLALNPHPGSGGGDPIGLAGRLPLLCHRSESLGSARSSALASKATGYPIARVSAKIAVGKRLDEITNAVTGKTGAAFEPALDYCVVKIPRWPFDKFPHGDRQITTQMKATGEVMAIDRSFEAALQKATPLSGNRQPHFALGSVARCRRRHRFGNRGKWGGRRSPLTCWHLMTCACGQ